MTFTLDDLLDLDELTDDIAAGYIRTQAHPTLPLAIYNYTEKAQFEKHWTNATRICRGLIVNTKTREIVARPFPKFFNYSEDVEAFSGRLSEPVEVTDKIDGSLGILFHYEGDPYIATRGSFTSDQAVHATALYREKYHGKWSPVEGFTYLFEIVYPENRIVLDYGDEDDLILLGAVGRSGYIAGPSGGICRPWIGPRTPTLSYSTLAEALKAEPRPNAEGLVVRFKSDDSTMVKIKQDDYVALHRIVTGLTQRTIWEWVNEGRNVDDLFIRLPEEFHDWASDVLTDLYAQAMSIYAAARAAFYGIAPGGKWTGDRRLFAEQAVTTQYATILFMMLDGRDLMPSIWKVLKPEATR